MLNNGGIKLEKSQGEYKDIICAKSLLGKNSVTPRSGGVGVALNNVASAHTSIFNASKAPENDIIQQNIMAVNTQHYHMLNTTNNSQMYDKTKDGPTSENHSNSVTQFSKTKGENYMDSVFPSSVRTAYAYKQLPLNKSGKKGKKARKFLPSLYDE